MTRRFFSFAGVSASIFAVLLFAGCSFSASTPDKSTNTSSATSATTSTSSASSSLLNKTFSDPEILGYSMGYPNDWTYSKKGDSTLLFTGAQESAQGHVATVNVQNLLTANNGGKYQTVDELYNDLKEQLVSGGAKVISESAFTYTGVGGTPLVGKQMVVEHTYEGEKYRQWQIALSGFADAGVFHAWAYTAPADVYDGSYEIAKAMLASWKIGE